MEVNPEPTAAQGGPRVSAAGLAVRSVVVLGAVLVVVAGGRVSPVPLFPLALGVVLALLRPATIGAWVALPAAAWAFVATAGTDPGLGPILLGVAGGYLVHTGTAAAAVVPVSARVSSAVAGRWLLRCLPAVVVTVVLAVVDDALRTTPRSSLFAVAAAAVTIGAALLLHRLFTTPSEPG